MKTTDLIKYELPTYTEFISVGWIQDIIAKRCAKKVNRKMARYRARLEREKFCAKHLLNNK